MPLRSRSITSGTCGHISILICDPTVFSKTTITQAPGPRCDFIRYEDDKSQLSKRMETHSVSLRGIIWLTRNSHGCRLGCTVHGFRPHPKPKKVSVIYKTALTPTGISGIHVKLRLSILGRGLFVAGLAHAPKSCKKQSAALAAASVRA